MFENLGLQKTSPSKPTKHYRHIFYLISVFMLLVGSVSPTAPASAAPPEDEIEYKLAVYMPDPPFCVGGDYPIRVQLIKDSGRGFHGIVGEKIEAFAQDENIGTISPPERYAFNVEAEDYDLGSVFFNFHAKKAGTTTLYFETSINGKYLGPKRVIKVVNCEYEVTMLYSGVVSGMFTVVEIGFMPALLKGEGMVYTGGGKLETTFAVSGPCGVEISKAATNATITGEIQNGKLNLRFEFPVVNVNQYVCCHGACGGGSGPYDAGVLGLTDASFPEAGGTQHIPFAHDWSGASGNITLVVEPVDSSGK